MNTIIAGRFGNITPAELAMQDLRAKHIAEQDICHFHNSPPGQHGTYHLGGDEDADPSARDGEDNAATVAAVAGVGGAILGATVAGPLGAVAGAGVGAYTGALVGALSGAGEHAATDAKRRQAGVMVAVRVDDPDRTDMIIDTLRQHGAQDIERASGMWHKGDWVDFDPVAPPHLVDEEALPHPHQDEDRPEATPVVFRVLREGGQWGVYEQGFKISIANFDTHDAAIAYAEALAQTKERADVEIYSDTGALVARQKHKGTPAQRAL